MKGVFTRRWHAGAGVKIKENQKGPEEHITIVFGKLCKLTILYLAATCYLCQTVVFCLFLFLKKLSHTVLMLYRPNDRWQSFSYHMKMPDKKLT